MLPEQLTVYPNGVSGSATASPSLSDIPYGLPASRRGQAESSASPFHPAFRINPYMEHLYSSFHSSPAVSLRGLSPVDTRGLPLHPDYLSQMAAMGPRSALDMHSTHPPSTAGSTELPFSLESSRLTSPRPSLRQSRKRALSSSPYSDSFDINSMIRFSPNSLISIMNGSRSSSCTSGSYGHLSAGTISPVLSMHPPVPPAHLQQLQHLMRQGSLPSSPFLFHHHQGTPGFSPHSLLMGGPTQMPPQMHHHHHHHPVGVSKVEPGELSSSAKDSPSNLVSSTVEPADPKKTRIKKEPSSTSGSSGSARTGGPMSMSMSSSSFDDRESSNDPMRDEPGDFIETDCHWKDCSKEFATQDELVKHINNDHIHTNKKSFVCRWTDCSRDEKPFKAQYMLVVHMRRHTGEKPHRCTFEGCAKAYSRLENLKTHLRSHTGEKPYMCEFPGCTKAFSNASDRAKHQNRTHSSEKPYVCKAPGCTKRYTDPSSLRKHVKTVHGPEFYANKKHKGSDQSEHRPSGDGGDKHAGSEGSPKSEDGMGGKMSLSSPSIKSEDSSSPQQQHSPGTESNVGSIAADHHCSDDLISDNNVSTTNGCNDIIEENEWEVPEPAEIEIPDVRMSISAAVATTGGGGSGDHVVHDRGLDFRNQLRNRLQSKGSNFPSLPQLPSIGGHRRGPGVGLGSPNRKITDLKTGTTTLNQRRLIDLSLNVNPNNNRLANTTGYPPTRRDSNTSTISSFYSSICSENSPHPVISQMSSRRGSEVSQMSSSAQMSPRGGGGQTHTAASSPFFDFISPGSSRRSSELGNLQGITASMSAHLQQLHRRALANQELGQQNLVVQTQSMSIQQQQQGGMSHTGAPWNMAASAQGSPSHRLTTHESGLGGVGGGVGRQTSMSCHTPLPHEIPNREVRRASDPVRPLDRNFGVDRRPGRYHSLNGVAGTALGAGQFNRRTPLPPIGGGGEGGDASCGGGDGEEGDDEEDDLRHPNEDVVLDECEEDRMVEENQNLVIPDEMVRYLNQVAENARLEREQYPEDVSRPVSALSHLAGTPSAVPQQPPPPRYRETTCRQVALTSPRTPRTTAPPSPGQHNVINDHYPSPTATNCTVQSNYATQAPPPPTQMASPNYPCSPAHVGYTASPAGHDMSGQSFVDQNVGQQVTWQQTPRLQQHHTQTTNYVAGATSVPIQQSQQHLQRQPNIDMAMSNMNLNTRARLQGTMQDAAANSSYGPGFVAGVNQSVGSPGYHHHQHQMCTNCQQAVTPTAGNQTLDTVPPPLTNGNQSNFIVMPALQQQRPSKNLVTKEGLHTVAPPPTYHSAYGSQLPSSPGSPFRPIGGNALNNSPHKVGSSMAAQCQNCGSQKPEIQCRDITQSSTLPPHGAGLLEQQNSMVATNGVVCPTVTVPVVTATDNRRPNPLGMRPDTYKRTLEYVQQCQTWASPVAAGTGPVDTDTRTTVGLDERTSNVNGLGVTTIKSEQMQVATHRQQLMQLQQQRGGMLAGMGTMVLSPGCCNKVSSTTDNQQDTLLACHQMDNMSSITDVNDNVLANASLTTRPFSPSTAISMAGSGRVSSRVTMLYESKAASQAAATPVLQTSNMVINDLNSTLTSLAEETRFLQMMH